MGAGFVAEGVLAAAGFGVGIPGDGVPVGSAVNGRCVGAAEGCASAVPAALGARGNEPGACADSAKEALALATVRLPWLAESAVQPPPNPASANAQMPSFSNG